MSAKIDNENILKEWKKSYIATLMRELSPKGNVLEIGFGAGDAAEAIQAYKPKSHTIIENRDQALKAAKKWAEKHPNVKIIEGNWKQILPSLGTFDTIFFGSYPSENEMDMIKYLNTEEARLTSGQAKDALKAIEEQMSKVKVKYTDQQIEEFFKTKGQHRPEEMASFFKNLKDAGFITKQQYDASVKKYHIQNGKEIKKTEAHSSDSPQLSFIQDCLKNHMNKGCRLSYYLNGTESNYEDADFFDKIITNTSLNYEEKLIPITLANFKPREALIILIEKK